MINILITPTVNLGLFIIILMILLIWVGNIKPEISADIDLIIVTLGILYGFIIIIHGWRLDPILFFSQILLIFALAIFGFLMVRLRMMILILSVDKDDLIEENKDLLEEQILQKINLRKNEIKIEKLLKRNQQLLNELYKKNNY